VDPAADQAFGGDLTCSAPDTIDFGLLVFMQRLEIAMRLRSKMVVIDVTVSALGLPIVTNGQERKKPMIIGEDVGFDRSYCESAKADCDLIAAIARERDSLRGGCFRTLDLFLTSSS
jgi:hypothetical protein